MNDKEKQSIGKIERKILIGESEKAIGVPIYISDLKTVLKIIKRQEEENESYKEELKKIDKALNLEAGRVAPYRHEIIESFKTGITQLKKIIDNSIPKSRIEEIRDKAEVMDYYTLPDVIEDLNKLLGESQEEEIEKQDNIIEELSEENEHYKDLMYALETYYNITEEDIEKCIKEDI